MDDDDRRHAAVVARFPSGFTPMQFRQVTLESADATDRVYPPSLASYFDRMSLLLGMHFEGLIRRHGGYNDPIEPFFITPKGREYFAEHPFPIPHPEESIDG